MTPHELKFGSSRRRSVLEAREPPVSAGPPPSWFLASQQGSFGEQRSHALWRAATACHAKRQMLDRTFRSAFALTFLSLGGCHNPFAGGYACPAVVSPAIVVEIRDAATGAAVANGARGAVHDGTYVDSLTPYESIGLDPSGLFSRRAADERPGTYSVEVNHPGYRTWTATGVRASAGTCGVQTRRISASLQPAP